jgi:hypothetical protein
MYEIYLKLNYVQGRINKVESQKSKAYIMTLDFNDFKDFNNFMDFIDFINFIDS